MALLSFLGRVACLRILIVARVLGARLRFCVYMWRVCTFLLELLAGVRASSLVHLLGRGRVPVVIEGADVVLLHISVFVGDCDGECNGHVVAERACLVAEACAVNVLLKRPRGCVAVDDSASVVGDGERASACETQRVVGTSDDSLPCE